MTQPPLPIEEEKEEEGEKDTAEKKKSTKKSWLAPFRKSKNKKKAEEKDDSLNEPESEQPESSADSTATTSDLTPIHEQSQPDGGPERPKSPRKLRASLSASSSSSSRIRGRRSTASAAESAERKKLLMNSVSHVVDEGGDHQEEEEDLLQKYLQTSSRNHAQHESHSPTRQQQQSSSRHGSSHSGGLRMRRNNAPRGSAAVHHETSDQPPPSPMRRMSRRASMNSAGLQSLENQLGNVNANSTTIRKQGARSVMSGGSSPTKARTSRRASISMTSYANSSVNSGMNESLSGNQQLNPTRTRGASRRASISMTSNVNNVNSGLNESSSGNQQQSPPRTRASRRASISVTSNINNNLNESSSGNQHSSPTKTRPSRRASVNMAGLKSVELDHPPTTTTIASGGASFVVPSSTTPKRMARRASIATVPSISTSTASGGRPITPPKSPMRRVASRRASMAPTSASGGRSGLSSSNFSSPKSPIRRNSRSPTRRTAATRRASVAPNNAPRSTSPPKSEKSLADQLGNLNSKAPIRTQGTRSVASAPAISDQHRVARSATRSRTTTNTHRGSSRSSSRPKRRSSSSSRSVGSRASPHRERESATSNPISPMGRYTSPTKSKSSTEPEPEREPSKYKPPPAFSDLPTEPSKYKPPPSIFDLPNEQEEEEETNENHKKMEDFEIKIEGMDELPTKPTLSQPPLDFNSSMASLDPGLLSKNSKPSQAPNSFRIPSIEEQMNESNPNNKEEEEDFETRQGEELLRDASSTTKPSQPQHSLDFSFNSSMASLDPGLLLKNNRPSKAHNSSRISSIDELYLSGTDFGKGMSKSNESHQFHVDTSVLDNAVLEFGGTETEDTDTVISDVDDDNTDDDNDEDISCEELELVHGQETITNLESPPKRGDALQMQQRASFIQFSPGARDSVVMVEEEANGRLVEKPLITNSHVTVEQLAAPKIHSTSSLHATPKSPKKKKEASDVPMSTKQLLPIAQYNDPVLGKPKSAKRTNPGTSKTKEKQENRVNLVSDVVKSTKQLLPIKKSRDAAPQSAKRSSSPRTLTTKEKEAIVNLASDVPMSTKQLMPIAQYNDTICETPKTAKRASSRKSTRIKKEKQPDPVALKSSMDEPVSTPEAPDRRSRVKKDGTLRRSTTRRPDRLDAKTSVGAEDSLKSPKSPRRTSGLSRKNRVKPIATPKQNSQTSGEPTDETIKSRKLDASSNASFNRRPKSKSDVARLQQPGEKEKAQERKQAINKGLDKFMEMVADDAPVSDIKDENRSVYSAIPEMERMRKTAKKQRDKRVSKRGDPDPDPNDFESEMNMSVGSMPGGNTSTSSGMDHRPVISLSKTHFSKKLKKLDLTF